MTPKAVEEPSKVEMRQPKYLPGRGVPAPCIVSGCLKPFVSLPEHVDRNEWLATHAYEFFHLINAMYGNVTSACTIASCPIMRIRAGPAILTLIWPPEFVTASREGHSSKSSMTTMFFSASNTLCREMSAANYVDSALTWIETQLETPERFPRAMKDQYPGEFEKRLLQPIFTLLYHVMAHIYEYHWDNIIALELEGHINALLAHFITFVEEFNLISGLDLEPLSALVHQHLFPREATETLAVMCSTADS